MLLDAQATSVTEVINVIVDQVASTHQLTEDQMNKVCHDYSPSDFEIIIHSFKHDYLIDGRSHDVSPQTSLRGAKIGATLNQRKKPQPIGKK